MKSDKTTYILSSIFNRAAHSENWQIGIQEKNNFSTEIIGKEFIYRIHLCKHLIINNLLFVNKNSKERQKSIKI